MSAIVARRTAYNRKRAATDAAGDAPPTKK